MALVLLKLNAQTTVVTVSSLQIRTCTVGPRREMLTVTLFM